MTKMISLVRTMCVTAIVSLLAQSVWADVVTTWPESGTSSTVPNDTIVFRGITLEQLKNDYAIGAKMGGIADDHIGSAKWAAHVIAASSDTELKVQFQLLDGNFLKWTTVKFVQDTDGEETVIKATQLASTRAETSYQNDWSNYLVLKTAEKGVGDKTAENYPLTWLKLIAHTYDSTEAAVSITDSDTLNVIRSSGDTYTFKGDNGVTLSFGSTTEAISSRLVFQGGATTTHEFTYSGNRGALFGRGATFEHPTILVDANAKLKFNAHDLHGWESNSIVSDSVIRVNNGGVLTCNNPGGTSHYAGCLYLEPGSEMNIHGFGTDNFRIHGGISDTVQQVYVPSPADGSEVTVAKITGTGVYMSKDGAIGFGMNIADGSMLEISAPINAHANTDKCKKFGAGELKITSQIGSSNNPNPYIITAEGKTTIASGDRKVDGTLEVLNGAELSFVTGDAIHYGGTSKIIASGTVNFNDKRQTFFSGNTMTLNPGAKLIGAGDQHAAIDLCDATTITLGGGEGEVTIDTPIRYRDANEFATYSTENEAGAKVLYKQLGKGSGGIAIGDNVEIEFVNIAFAHAIKGSGRATFTQKVPAAAGKAKFSSADDWTGDVMFKNIDNLNSSQGGQAFNFTTYGNASSTITCDGAAGWLESATVQSELKLVGNGFCVRDGSSGSNWCYIFNKISGSGPFKCDYGNDGVEVSGKNFQPIHIKDASEFTGAFWTDCSGIWITDSSTVGSSNGAEWAKKIIVDDGKTVTMGAEWTAPAGIYVNGNVTANCGNRKFKSNVEVGSTGTLTMSASDLINYDASSDQTIKIAGTLSCGNKRQSLGGHNKLIVVAGATISGAGDGEGAIDNFGGSKMTVEAATGDNAPTTVDWSAAVRYRSQPEFAIADGVTVNMSGAVMSESTYAKTVNKTGAGTLNLTGSVSAYITHKLSEGKITSNSATLNVTSGVDGKVVRKITADGVTTYDLAVAAMITIPSVDHTTVAATVNGVTVDPSSGSLSVYVGDAVVVTYSAAEGYMMTDKVVNLDVTETTTITVPEGTTPQLIVATVNGTPFASLADAKDACTGGETIVIVSNLTGLTHFARSSDYTNVGAIEIVTGVTVKGYFQSSGKTIPLVINGTFEITDGFSNQGNSATIPSLSGSGKITKSWSNNPKIYVENHAGIWTGTVDGCVHLSVAKSADAYYYDANAIISALRDGTEVTNIGYTAETVPAGLEIDGDKLVLATYTVELKTFDHTACYVKVNNGEETEYTEAITVKHGDRVDFRYVAVEGYNITSEITELHYSSVTSVISGGTYTIETAIKQFTITISPVEHTTVTVDGVAYTESTKTVEYGTTHTIVYTADTNYKLSGEGSFTLTNVTADQTVGEGLSAELDVTTITIPEAPANTVVKVTVNGAEVDATSGSITATIGATVVVTYSAAEGYIMSDVSTTLTAGSSTEITVPTEAPVQAVAKIGTTLYPTLAAAFAAGGEVTLLQNTTETLTIAAGKSVTLDLNGKTITSAANTITVKGTLVVTEAAGGIASTGSGKSAITTSGSGTFTINGGAITAVGTAVSGVGTITGGTITSSGSFAVYANSSSGSIVITGGTITGAAAKGDVGVYTGNVTVTGATLTNGIKFASNASGIILAGTDTELFTPEVGIYDDDEMLVGYAPAQTTGTISAMAGKTVKLLKDCTTTDYLTIGKSCTLDLNGHNLTTSAAAAIVVKGTSATPSVVTITGSGKVSSTAADCNAVQIGAYATVTIAGGEYVVPTDNAAIYIATSYAAKPSTVAITGGSFASGDGKYVLNIKDDQIARGAAITVTGGTFKGFDPAANNDATVAEGKMAVKDGDNYIVVDYVEITEEHIEVSEESAAVTVPTGADEIVIETVMGEEATGSTIPLTTTGLYTVSAKKGEIVVATEQIGVVAAKTEATTDKTTTAVAVPFTGATVANLLNTALLTKDDMLMAYLDGNYKSWKLTAEKTWTPVTTLKDGEGEVDVPAAKDAVLKRGTAVWVTTAGKVVVLGKYNEKTEIVEPTTAETHLLANPTMKPYTPSVKAGDKQDQVIEIGTAKPTRYTKKNGKWTAPVVVGHDDFFDLDIYQEQTADPKIPVGKGFWFIKK